MTALAPPTTAVEVRVLDLTVDPGPDAFRTLSAEERAQAARRREGPRRDRYVRAHVGLRQVVGEATGVGPAAVALVRDDDGRPGLASGVPDLNLAYDGTIAAVALSADHRVGVDVVAPRGADRLAHLARAALTPWERGGLGDDPGGVQGTFAAKEAYLKLLGCGLRRPPRDLEVVWDDTSRTTGTVRDRHVAVPRVLFRSCRLPDGTVVVAAVAVDAAAIPPAVSWRAPAGEVLP